MAHFVRRAASASPDRGRHCVVGADPAPLALAVAAIALVACYEAPVTPVARRAPINTTMAQSAGTTVLHVDAQSAPDGDGFRQVSFPDNPHRNACVYRWIERDAG